METIKSAADLKQAILDLESRQYVERQEMYDHFSVFYEYNKPSNILRRTIVGALGTVHVKNNVLSIILGMASGYVGKKIIVGKSHNPIKHLVGNVFMLTLGNFVTRHPEVGRTVETVVKKITQLVTNSNHSARENEEEDN